MIKRLFTVFTLILILSSSSFSQSDTLQSMKAKKGEIERSGGLARVQSMGLNPYIIDPYYMTINPAWASDYYDFLWGDLGSTATSFGNDGVGEFVGFNFKVTNELVLGALLTRNDTIKNFSLLSPNIPPNIPKEVLPASFNLPYGPLVFINNLVGDISGAIPVNNNFEIIAAYRLSELSLGLGVSYASSTYQFNPATGGSTEIDASQIGINLGVITHTNLLKLDGSFNILFPSVTRTAPNVKDQKASRTYLNAQLRLFYKVSSKFSLIPIGSFMTSSGKHDYGSVSTDYPNLTMFRLGLGLGYTIGDILFSGGPSFSYFASTTKGTEGNADETSSIIMFPLWNIGAEWYITDWMTGRFGYIAINLRSSSESANGNKVDETIYSYDIVSQALIGLGFKIGKLSLDATVNVDVLRQGLANLGNKDAGPTFSWLSVSYGF